MFDFTPESALLLMKNLQAMQCPRCGYEIPECAAGDCPYLDGNGVVIEGTCIDVTGQKALPSE